MPNKGAGHGRLQRWAAEPRARAEVSAAVGTLGQPVGAQRVLTLPPVAADLGQRVRQAQAQRLAPRLL